MGLEIWAFVVCNHVLCTEVVLRVQPQDMFLKAPLSVHTTSSEDTVSITINLCFRLRLDILQVRLQCWVR